MVPWVGLQCLCYCSVALTHSAMGWSAVSLLLFCSSTSWCRGFVCSVGLWYFLIILTCFFLILGRLNYPFSPKKGCQKNIVHLSNSESLHQGLTKSYFVLFDLILYVPSTIFHLNRDGSSWVEPILS